MQRRTQFLCSTAATASRPQREQSLVMMYSHYPGKNTARFDLSAAPGQIDLKST